MSYLIAIGLGGGYVVLDGAWDGGPLGMHKAHDMITQLGGGAIQGGVLVPGQVDDDPQLCHIHHFLDVLLAHCPQLVLQLPAWQHRTM